MSSSPNSHGPPAALAAAVLFGVSTPLAKDLLANIPSTLLAGLLYLGAALFLAPWILRRRLRGERSSVPRDRRNRLLLLGAIVFGGMIGPVLLLIGLRLAHAASVSMWLNLETVATAVIAVLVFREQLGRWTWLGNLGVFLAGLLLSLDSGRPGLLAGALVAAAAVAWGIDNNLTSLIDGISPVESTFWKGLVAGTTNLALGVALAPIAAPDRSWLAALCVGGLCYGASIVLYISAAQSMGAARSQLIFASSPFFGVAVSLAWLGESLSPAQVVAALIMVASLALMFMERHEHQHAHEPMEHEHSHRHDDLHHDHEHPEMPESAAGKTHSHIHVHAARRHSHPHWPDLHHRHSHD